MNLKLQSFLQKIFFSNFFLILITLSLCVEFNLKQGLNLNSFEFYFFISSVTVLFYLYAYRITTKLTQTANPRTQFYIEHQKGIINFKIFLFVCSLISGVYLLYKSLPNFDLLPLGFYVMMMVSAVFIFAYYENFSGISLRKFTWLKPLLIAWAWTITTSILPLVFLILENGQNLTVDFTRFGFLLTQNFMYFLVNAILFDVKDYEDDSNRNLKTFVVKYGDRFMIYHVIIPLLILGTLSFISFGLWYNLPLHRIVFMLIPIFILTYLVFKMNKPKSILFYLIVIDGMLLVKALFGILSVLLFE